MSRLHTLVAGLATGWWLGWRAGRRRGPGHAPAAHQFDFLTLMSHELKTPLNVIGGYLELLEDDVPEPLPPSAREHVRQARMASARMTELVANLLTWARLEGRIAHVCPEATTAAHIVREASRTQEEQAVGRGVRFETRVPADLTLRTDPSKAVHALSALIANAVKFTDSGSVRVSADRSGGRVRFRVEDTGIGIARENLRRIFAPYWQLESSVRRSYGGVGLGLTLARRLARLLGGDVEVRSAPGAGSVFVLDLPGG